MDCAEGRASHIGVAILNELKMEVAMLEQLRTRFGHWIRYRDTVRQLSYRDPYLLRDMGFERTDMASIRRCARMAVEGKCD